MQMLSLASTALAAALLPSVGRRRRSRLFAQERQAREALEHADELKSEFVALAAHELRSPVGAI